MEPTERIEAEQAGDRRADTWSILVIFCVLIAGALHFVSGWTP